MIAEVKNMTPKEIRIAGVKALAQNLGSFGMIRFLQDTDQGYGDYTKDRYKWLGDLDLEEIKNEMQNTTKR